MTGLLQRWWPKSLAVRLTVLLVATLALAQLGLALLLSHERDSVVEDLLHSQALQQTVTLARLLEGASSTESDRLLQAFGSRRTCVALETGASGAMMSRSEQELARVLEAMLHGIDVGKPTVTIDAAGGDRRACADAALRADDDDDRDDDNGEEGEASLTMEVPLPDGRWLIVRSAVVMSAESGRLTILSFLVSALAVGLVTVWAVRSQTRRLRDLADASDRFGRGEKVDLLPVSGPSEVSAATAAFNTMRQRLSQFIAERMQLLASISHDLRTPLTTLRLKAELLDDEAARDDLVATIDELSRIAEATLAFTRAEAAGEDTERTNLAELVREVISEFDLAGANVAPVRLEPVEARCRQVAMKRAVRNLVENAVRYGTSARVSLYRDGDDAVIEVVDEGPGIPEEQIQEAFKPFVRLEPSRSAETGGIGLGLAIALGIVHAHGGALSLTNLVDRRGLRAEIRLPAIPTQSPGL